MLLRPIQRAARTALLVSVLVATLVPGIAGARDPASATSAPPAAPGAPAVEAAALELETLDGKVIHPLAPGNERLSVLIFVSNDCPIANRYAPEIQRIAEKYEPRGVRFWMVHPLPGESLESIRDHAASYALPGTVARDRKLDLTRWLGITVTPEVAVVDRARRVVYRGRIDNRFPALGQKRFNASQRDLRDALEALLAGKPVPNPRTKAVGCVLPKSG